MLILRIIWELPQNILGALLWIILAPSTSRHGTQLFCNTNKIGVSLGIFVYAPHVPHAIAHEYGHAKQSMMLGPLYLLAVGIPSLIQNILTRSGALKRERYFERYPEKWADQLGGVKRG